MKIFIKLILLFAICSVNLRAASDIKLLRTNASTFAKTYTDYDMYYALENVAGTVVTYTNLLYQLDNGTIYSHDFTFSIPSKGSIIARHSQALKISTSGYHTLKVWIEALGDTNRKNDTISLQIYAGSLFSPKVSLFENFTATWCPNCPNSTVNCELMDEKSNIAVAAFHNNDQMSFPAGENYFKKYYKGTIFSPGGVKNKGEMDIYEVNAYSTSWHTHFDDPFNEASYASLYMTKTIDPVTRELKATLFTQFDYAISGDYSFNAYVVEDSLIYTQTNSFDNVHNNVVIHMMGGENGISGIVPATPLPGVEYKNTFTYVLPSKVNLKRVRVVGMLISTKNGKKAAINAVKEKKSFGSTSSINSASNEDQFEVIHNGFENDVTIKFLKNDSYKISIISNTGSLITSNSYDSNINSEFKIKLDDLNISKGIYFLKITNKDTNYIKQIAKL